MNARALDREVSVIIRSVVQVARDTGYKGPRWPIVRAALDNGAIVNAYQRWTDADVEAACLLWYTTTVDGFLTFVFMLTPFTHPHQRSA